MEYLKDEEEIDPSLTAISRKAQKSQAYRVAKKLWKRSFKTDKILDYGCGFGEEADENGFYKSDKYMYGDNILIFCKAYVSEINPKFDKIICSCVLNTITCKENRIKVVQDVFRKLKSNGQALFTYYKDAPRTERRNWISHSDGFILKRKSGTHFQKRFNDTTFIDIITEAVEPLKGVKGIYEFKISRVEPGAILLEKGPIIGYDKRTEEF